MKDSIFKEFLAEFFGSLPRVRLVAHQPDDEDDVGSHVNPASGLPLLGPDHSFDANGNAPGASNTK